MLPIRCYTCNASLSEAHAAMSASHARNDPDRFHKGFEEQGVARMCCQRMFLGYVDLSADLVQYSNTDVDMDTNGTRFLRHVAFERVVSCD